MIMANEFVPAFKKAINIADPRANSSIGKDDPMVKILADWGRTACDKMDKLQSENERLKADKVLEDRQVMLETLQENEKPFGLLSDEEQNFMCEKHLNIWIEGYARRKWRSCGGCFVGDYNMTYRISPDYDPDVNPEEQYEDKEVDDES